MKKILIVKYETKNKNKNEKYEKRVKFIENILKGKAETEVIENVGEAVKKWNLGENVYCVVVVSSQLRYQIEAAKKNCPRMTFITITRMFSKDREANLSLLTNGQIAKTILG